MYASFHILNITAEMCALLPKHSGMQFYAIFRLTPIFNSYLLADCIERCQVLSNVDNHVVDGYLLSMMHLQLNV